MSKFKKRIRIVKNIRIKISKEDKKAWKNNFIEFAADLRANNRSC